MLCCFTDRISVRDKRLTTVFCSHTHTADDDDDDDDDTRIIIIISRMSSSLSPLECVLFTHFKYPNFPLHYFISACYSITVQTFGNMCVENDKKNLLVLCGSCVIPLGVDRLIFLISKEVI